MSVNVDIKNKKVSVNHPCLKVPIQFLTDRHQGRCDQAQAERVYLSQCRKNDVFKEGMRKVHKDLVDKGFMIKLENMEKYKQDPVNNASVQHFNPRGLVLKADSVSTLVRSPVLCSYLEKISWSEQISWSEEISCVVLLPGEAWSANLSSYNQSKENVLLPGEASWFEVSEEIPCVVLLLGEANICKKRQGRKHCIFDG